MVVLSIAKKLTMRFLCFILWALLPLCSRLVYLGFLFVTASFL